jgi:hypothetical protein
MGSRRIRELQRYFDGELSPRRARKMEEHLSRSPDDQRRLETLRAMRRMLQEANEEAVQQSSFDRLWAHVQIGIAARRAPSLGQRVRSWLRSYGLMAASATAAALLALFLWLPTDTTTHNDCNIESLDADPGAMSTIFTIDTPEDGNKTTVIWVNELGEPVPEDQPTESPAEGQGEAP